MYPPSLVCCMDLAPLWLAALKSLCHFTVPSAASFKIQALLLLAPKDTMLPAITYPPSRACWREQTQSRPTPQYIPPIRGLPDGLSPVLFNPSVHLLPLHGSISPELQDPCLTPPYTERGCTTCHYVAPISGLLRSE